MSDATADIIRLLESNNIDYLLLRHAPCATSEESQRARASAGGGVVVGAKALAVKMTFRGGEVRNGLLVLPGNRRLSTRALERALEGLRKVRFATSDEVTALARGVRPGHVPPIGRPVFPAIDLLLVDSALLEHDRLGFNVAAPDMSIVMGTSDYMRAARPNSIMAFSEATGSGGAA